MLDLAARDDRRGVLVLDDLPIGLQEPPGRALDVIHHSGHGLGLSRLDGGELVGGEFPERVVLLLRQPREVGRGAEDFGDAEPVTTLDGIGDGGEAPIQANPSRAIPPPRDTDLSAERHKVENLFRRIRRFRRFALRCGKTPSSLMGFVLRVPARDWLR